MKEREAITVGPGGAPARALVVGVKVEGEVLVLARTDIVGGQDPWLPPPPSGRARCPLSASIASSRSIWGRCHGSLARTSPVCCCFTVILLFRDVNNDSVESDAQRDSPLCD